MLYKYDEEEFKKNVERIAKEHDIPEEAVTEWLLEAYAKVEYRYRKQLKHEANKDKKKTKWKFWEKKKLDLGAEQIEELKKETIYVGDNCDNCNYFESDKCGPCMEEQAKN